MADDDVVVEIENETAPADKGATAVETHTVDPVADLKAQHEELKAREKIERDGRLAETQRADAERQARVAAEREAEAARTESTDTRRSAVESGLAAAQTESDAAEVEMVSAQEAGDWKRVAVAQRRLADARYNIGRLNEAKADLETTPVRSVQRQAQETPRAPVQLDPIEAFISGPLDEQGNRRHPQAQQWLREHTEYITDPRKLKKLGAADMDAQAEGIAINTPEYFAHVEKFLGLSKAASTNGAARAGTQRRASAPVAPVTSSPGGTSGGSEVRLSQQEAAAATDGTLIWNYDDTSPQKRFKKGDPIGIQEMARRKQKMSEQGLYNPMNFVQQ